MVKEKQKKEAARLSGDSGGCDGTAGSMSSRVGTVVLQLALVDEADQEIEAAMGRQWHWWIEAALLMAVAAYELAITAALVDWSCAGGDGNSS